MREAESNEKPLLSMCFLTDTRREDEILPAVCETHVTEAALADSPLAVGAGETLWTTPGDPGTIGTGAKLELSQSLDTRFERSC